MINRVKGNSLYLTGCKAVKQPLTLQSLIPLKILKVTSSGNLCSVYNASTHLTPTIIFSVMLHSLKTQNNKNIYATSRSLS